jgi:hypothetical protein
MFPLVMLSSRLVIRSRVVLPQPEGPRKTAVSPRSIVKVHVVRGCYRRLARPENLGYGIVFNHDELVKRPIQHFFERQRKSSIGKAPESED